MGFYKASNPEKTAIEVIKLYISLYPYWKNKYISGEVDDNSEIYFLLLNILFIDEMLLINLSEDEIKIVKNGMIHKKKGLEYIAYSMYYSESGLRNQVNLISKKMFDSVKDKLVYKVYDDGI